jgi:hypothetical protein
MIGARSDRHSESHRPPMSKAFTKESDDDLDDDIVPALDVPKGTKNYITPWGWSRLKTELKHLVEVERPEVTRVVSWAASNGGCARSTGASAIS